MATHHLISTNEKGFFCINRIQYGQSRTLDGIIDTLRVPRDNWPVQLKG